MGRTRCQADHAAVGQQAEQGCAKLQAIPDSWRAGNLHVGAQSTKGPCASWRTCTSANSTRAGPPPGTARTFVLL